MEGATRCALHDSWCQTMQTMGWQGCAHVKESVHGTVLWVRRCCQPTGRCVRHMSGAIRGLVEETLGLFGQVMMDEPVQPLSSTREWCSRSETR